MNNLALKCVEGRWQPRDTEDLPAVVVAEVVRQLHEIMSRCPLAQPDGYITISDGCNDEALEVRCAPKHSSIFRRPFALTEEDAKKKLSAWLEKQRLKRRNMGDQSTNTTEPSLVDQPAQDDLLRTTTVPNTKTPPVGSDPPFATTEADAVRALRERGYHVLPTQSPVQTGIITPPPGYSRYPCSQPIERSTEDASMLAFRTITRKRKAASVPSTPVREHYVVAPLTRPATSNINSEIHDNEAEEKDGDHLDIPTIYTGRNANNADDADDAGDASDEMCETPPRQHKRRKITTTRTASAASTL